MAINSNFKKGSGRLTSSFARSGISRVIRPAGRYSSLGRAKIGKPVQTSVSRRMVHMVK